MKIDTVILLTAMFLPSYALGADFYLAMNSCKIVVGVPFINDEGIKVMDSTKYIASCTRAGDTVTCDFSFDDNSEPNKAIYKVVLESPPLLHMAMENGAEYIAIHQTNHAAVGLTRAVGQEYLAGKICQGMYATKFEYDALKEKK